MRFDQNFGRLFWLNPHFWGIALASINAPLALTLTNIALFSVGGWFAHGAGCAINDYLDIEIDRKNERTKKRPLVTGLLTKTQAKLIIASLVGGSFAILS